MQRYLRQNRLSGALDAIGRKVIILVGSLAMFVYLWGLRPPAVIAGAALAILIHFTGARFRRHRMQRREKALRRAIGAELKMEDMLLSAAQDAHAQAAALLQMRWPLRVQHVSDAGALCRLGEETLLVMCVRMPPEGEASVGDLIAGQRAVRLAGADRGVMCMMGRITPKIAAKAEETAVPLRIVRRETLLQLAGQAFPATNAQLVQLGQRRARISRSSLPSLLLRADKARRYFAYGLLMLLMYLLSGARLYVVPGMTCLTLGFFCRARPAGQEPL